MYNHEQIEEVCTMIEAAIVYREEHSPDNLAAKISDLINLYPNSCEAMASAAFIRDYARKQEYDKVVNAIKTNQIGKDMAGVTSASNLSKYIDSRIATQNYLVLKTERLNRAITHALDGYRSILSSEKEQLKLSNYGL